MELSAEEVVEEAVVLVGLLSVFDAELQPANAPTTKTETIIAETFFFINVALLYFGMSHVTELELQNFLNIYEI